ncbi:unnamed protein product [Acanthoscelides obtectus]|uniref:Peptidase S1 domain-containing protein n=1 Tax=Acanthoscelides obtectus TaxID=200917 RepID=A0A9P0JLZ7_ACAOB|nr:unnamed protein product [Acanthoscelides obtectus]CAK1658114.1 Serine proteinase stubble [Acanthoscelides obtectus]
MFVTMFGYPSNCENMGNSYPCTLSFACWLVGGSSQPGCGASSWIISCCVVTKKKALAEFQDTGDDFQTLESREDAIPLLQKRADDYDDRDSEQCGVTADRAFSKRIIGGKKALFGQYPWQAYIKIATYQCGGVLVSRRFVATAAHCIINARLKEILVYLGELDTQDTGDVEELAPAELHRVKKRIIHPKFRYRSTQPDLYDLSLLELLTEAGRAFHIIPICLPHYTIDLAGRSGVVAGWGKVQPSNELIGTNVLRSASVPLLAYPAETMPIRNHLPPLCSIKGPPESPWQLSLPPVLYPAHSISSWMVTWIPFDLQHVKSQRKRNCLR